MKNIILTMFAVMAVFSLSACETTGYFDSEPPYGMERTASGHSVPPLRVDVPTPEPMPVTCAPAPACEACVDTAPLYARIRELESLLARCQEGKSRVQSSYREELMK